MQGLIKVTSYTFKIEDFNPENMPFGRLVDYYAEIKKLLGVNDSLHLLNIVEGSHGSCFAIDRNFESELVKRLLSINDGTAPVVAMRAKSKINAMLKEDGTSGAFYDERSQNVIQFPGKRDDAVSLIKVRDTATFVGELYHLAGTKDDVKVRISTDSYGVVFCTTTKDMAKSLRDFLFEEVKVTGRGMWTRREDGTWEVNDFSITDFAPVKRESLRKAINRIRALNIDWPDDPLGDIDRIEERNVKVR
jgi:hypothetical protein